VSASRSCSSKALAGGTRRPRNFCAGLLDEYDALWTFCGVEDIEIS
jgi:hypothetical protein